MTPIASPSRVHEVEIGPWRLPGLLGCREDSAGLVIFAHGSGSSRLSPRNQYVAQQLREHGLSTLLFDLLTAEEGADRQRVFDIPLLAERLAGAVRWAQEDERTRGMPIGLFGASTGAAAALVAAARLGAQVGCVVSRGGRPDLAGDSLASVAAPTLLIVGGRDEVVFELNENALARLPGEAELVVVEGATHLFEEPGTLDSVVELATEWFLKHLKTGGSGHVRQS